MICWRAPTNRRRRKRETKQDRAVETRADGSALCGRIAGRMRAAFPVSCLRSAGQGACLGGRLLASTRTYRLAARARRWAFALAVDCSRALATCSSTCRRAHCSSEAPGLARRSAVMHSGGVRFNSRNRSVACSNVRLPAITASATARRASLRLVRASACPPSCSPRLASSNMLPLSDGESLAGTSSRRGSQTPRARTAQQAPHRIQTE